MCPTSRPAAALSRAALLGVLTLLPAASIAGDAKEDSAPKGRLFVAQDSRFHPEMSGIGMIDVAQGTWVRLIEGDSRAASVSPDGRSLAYVKLGRDGALTTEDLKAARLWLVDLQGARPPADLFGRCGRPCWSPDGKRLIVSAPTDPGRRLSHKSETWRMDADGSNRVKLPLPDTEFVADWSPDGQWLLTHSSRPSPEGTEPRLGALLPTYLMRIDGTGERLLVPEELKDPRLESPPAALIHSPRFSHDGRRVACTGRVPKKDFVVCVVDVDGSSKPSMLKIEPPIISNLGLCWSPDGKWLAVSLPEVGPDRRAPDDYHVELMRPDGSDRRRINLPPFGVLSLLDWRPPEK